MMLSPDRAARRGRIKIIAFTAMYSACAVALSAIEGMLPPLPFAPPGFKLGLSNIAIMLAVLVAGAPGGFFSMLSKSAAVFFLRGSSAFFMSISGGAASLICMVLLLKKTQRKLGYIGICVICAVVHSSGQIAAFSLLAGSAALLYLPVALLYSVLTGVLTGLLLYSTARVTRRFE